jgi:hypothetical protein
LSGLLDHGDTPARAQLFKNLNTPVNVSVELKDSPDFTIPVFRFLSRTIFCIGFLSLTLLLTAPPNQRTTVLWFALLTLVVGASLKFVGRSASIQSPYDGEPAIPVPTNNS